MLYYIFTHILKLHTYKANYGMLGLHSKYIVFC